MTLGTFTPRSRVAGDKLDLRQQWVYGRPYLVQPVEYSDSFNSKMANNGQGGIIEAVWFDLMDVQTGQVLINVLTTSGALVDNFKSAVGSGTVLPLKLIRQTGGKFGGYAAPVELDPAEMAAASQAYNSWPMVAQERARREAAAQAAAGNNPQGGFGGQPQGFGGQAPQQGFQQQAPQGGGMFGGQQNQAPQQGGFGAPASGFEQPQGQPQWGNQQPNQAPAQGFGGNPGLTPAPNNPATAPGQFGGQAPAQGFGNPGPGNDPSQGQFGQQAPQGGQFGGAPAQGQFQQQAPQNQGQFGGPVQGFQGQPQQGGQFGAPQQDPNQGQFQQPAPGQNNPAAQAALNQLNSGQFQ